MARARSLSRSYSPRRRSRSPPRERKRYDDDRHRRCLSSRDRDSSDPSGLLIRNLPLDARPNDLRIPFERFGPLKDIYLPKNYYTGEPRGFGFVKFRYAEDAAEAKQRMNHKVIGGREISIVFAEENRKTPQEMRTSNRSSGRYGGRTSDRSPRRRYHSHSSSPSPARRDHQRDREVRDDDLHTPRRLRSRSRSRSRSYEREGGSKRLSRSPRRNVSPSYEREGGSKPLSRSPQRNGRSPREERDLTPIRSRSPSRSRSRSIR